MYVSLLEDIRALGPKGATVDVPDGYALNFLFPQHMAVKVDDSATTDRQEVERLKTVKREKISPDQELAGEIDGMEVVIQEKAKKGKLVNPVTSTEVRAALKEMGYKLPKSAIKMEMIDTPGTLEVPVEFDSGFEATLSVVIEAV